MCCLILFLHFFVTGARVNAKDSKWLTPLHRAVASCSEVCFFFSSKLLCIILECLEVPSVLCSVIMKCNYSQRFELQNTCTSLFNRLMVCTCISYVCVGRKGGNKHSSQLCFLIKCYLPSRKDCVCNILNSSARFL